MEKEEKPEREEGKGGSKLSRLYFSFSLFSARFYLLSLSPRQAERGDANMGFNSPVFFVHLAKECFF